MKERSESELKMAKAMADNAVAEAAEAKSASGIDGYSENRIASAVTILLDSLILTPSFYGYNCMWIYLSAFLYEYCY